MPLHTVLSAPGSHSRNPRQVRFLLFSELRLQLPIPWVSLGDVRISLEQGVVDHNWSSFNFGVTGTHGSLTGSHV